MAGLRHHLPEEVRHTSSEPHDPTLSWSLPSWFLIANMLGGNSLWAFLHMKATWERHRERDGGVRMAMNENERVWCFSLFSNRVLLASDFLHHHTGLNLTNPLLLPPAQFCNRWYLLLCLALLLGNYYMCGGEDIPQHTCRIRSTACRSWFFPSIMWDLETELRVSALPAVPFPVEPSCWPSYSF